MTKKPTFTVKTHNVLKPKKNYFFIGEKHFSNPGDESAMTELIKLLQKALIKPMCAYTVRGHNILVYFQDEFYEYFLMEEMKAAAFLEQKRYVYFVFHYIYRGVLGIIQIVLIIGIEVLKVTALGLEKVARYPFLAFIFFFILLAWVFSKLKKTKKNDPNNEKDKRNKDKRK